MHGGAGAYICGEETGLLESLEGKKGQPRKKPPFPAQYGAFGLPTTVNNIETFAHVPFILERGVEWFKGRGTEKSPGTTLFGVSGHVERPGLFELPLGTPLREVLGHAGGVRGGRRLKGVMPGGLSMPILPPTELDVPMAEEFLSPKGTHLGTGGVMVMDETTCMVRVAMRRRVLLPRRVVRPVHAVPRGHRPGSTSCARRSSRAAAARRTSRCSTTCPR